MYLVYTLTHLIVGLVYCQFIVFSGHLGYTMAMQQSIAQTLTTPSQADDTIAGERASFYWKATWMAIVVLVGAEIALHYISQPAYISRVVEGLLFLGAGWLMMRRRRTMTTVTAAGAFVGFITGLVIAIFEMARDPLMWRVFNIIARPIWMAAFGAVVAGGFAFCISRFFSTQSAMKGGEHHG